MQLLAPPALMEQLEEVKKNTMFYCRVEIGLRPQRPTARWPDMIGVLPSYIGEEKRGCMICTVMVAWKCLAPLPAAAELRGMVSSSCW